MHLFKRNPSRIKTWLWVQVSIILSPLNKTRVAYHVLIDSLFYIALNLFEVSTLGQPFEVIKTQLAANRGQSMVEALKTIYSRGGVLGFYQGLIPWAWIEAGTKGAVLLFTASEFEFRARLAGASPFMVRVCVCVCIACGV